MRRSVMDLIVEYLLAGHSVTICTPERSTRYFARMQVCLAMNMADEDEGNLVLANGAVVQFVDLSEYSGAAALHTPVVVLQDVAKANGVLVPDARAIGCRFPDGQPPIIIEC
jgi:hypothetical protein